MTISQLITITTYNGTTNNNDVGAGVNALAVITTTTDNVAIGANALSAYSGGAGETTAIGSGAGVAQTDYTQCTFLGRNADANAATLTNATAIGYNAKVAISNAMVLTDGNCNVGIGTSSPSYGLHLGTAAGAFVPQIYLTDTVTAPAVPGVAGDAIFSVVAGAPTIISGMAQYSGTVVVSNITPGAGTSGISTALAFDAVSGLTKVTITTASVSATSRILITRNDIAAVPATVNFGSLTVANVASGSFDIYSSVATDFSTVSWLIVN